MRWVTFGSSCPQVRERSGDTGHRMARAARIARARLNWSARESVQAKLRLMVKRILRKYKYPPDQQESAIDLVLQQARELGEAWA